MKSLNEWLVLTADERTKLERLNDLVQSGAQEQAIAYLQQLKIDELIKFLEKSPALVKFCLQSEVEPFLLQHIEQQFNINNSETKFQVNLYNSLSTLHHLQGRFFHKLSVDIRKELPDKIYSIQELGYLKKSATYHCFYALKALVAHQMSLLQENRSQETINQLLGFARAAADYHWTPGYILLSQAYLIAYKNTSDPIYGTHALQSLLIARKLSDYPESKKAINDAYYGMGLIKGIGATFNDWDEAIKQLVAQMQLKPAEIDSSYNCADSTAHELIKSNTPARLRS